MTGGRVSAAGADDAAVPAVQALSHRGLVKNVADVYALTLDQLMNLERMGRKSAEKLLANIDASRQKHLSRILNALGIPFVGERTAQILADHFGDLDKIIRCVRLGGFINAKPDYASLPAVMNGASDLMVEVLGDAGRHARTTIGVAELPMDAAVEVEAIFEVA